MRFLPFLLMLPACAASAAEEKDWWTECPGPGCPATHGQFETERLATDRELPEADVSIEKQEELLKRELDLIQRERKLLFELERLE
ncbi:hypothetical protein [Bauldia sp.]|uniref:hypothetical protein n=1 Tax=Bauldia sp. TaxID=2575872 RepID=UPI003BABE72B